MKIIIYCMLFTFVSVAVQAQSDYYWYKGEKVYLQQHPDKKFVLLEEVADKGELKRSFSRPDLEIDRFAKTSVQSSLTSFKGRSTTEKTWAAIKGRDIRQSRLSSMQVQDRRSISYEAPFYLTSAGDEVGLSHLFYVKLKKAADVTLLEDLAKEQQVEILGNNRFMPLWYTLACTNQSAGNALEMANLFYERGLFSASEPDIMVDYLENCVNDTHFNNQWGLDNTGQNGGTNEIDIRACEAWDVTRGDDDIVVAVLDHGIELDHPDLTNISPLSFDTGTGTSPSQVLGSHGTACAGIIGAATGNNLGITGIAPDSPLMSISNSLLISPGAQQELADGLNWAWQNGADVISNSWGHNSLTSTLIDDAIDSALTQGRGGLGCVVIFAAGNDNGAVSYPANSNPDILAVGAMSPCGERKNPDSCDDEDWGSNFGVELDIVAPGVLIPTTDRQGGSGYHSTDYTQTFNGTSSACPHVAGVAALVLSVNPCLTQQQVAEIIESTAQKVGVYAYQNTPGRNNGTWDDEMGYGLVDATAAVEAAGMLFLQNETVTANPVIHSASFNIIAGSNVTPVIPSGNYIVAFGADVTFTAGITITLAPGFQVNSGSNFHARVEPFTCTPGSQVRTTHSSTSQHVTIEVGNTSIVQEIKVYPNPAYQKVTFSYQVAQDQTPVTLKVYNMQGQQVAVVMQGEEKQQGKHQTVFDGIALPEGLYIYHLQVGSQVHSGKFRMRR